MEAEPIVLFAGIAFLSISLIVTVICLIWYSGLLYDITVGAGPPPCSNLKVAYKFGRGPYKDVGAVFTEVTSLAPKLKCFGVYYDDPKQIPAAKLRWAVGTVLAEDSDEPDPALLQGFTKEGFKLFHFPSVNNVVKTSFPYRTQLSVIVGIYRVYPQLASYIKQMKLCAHPFMEVYTPDTIHYFAPLSKQEGFYVPEAVTDSGVHFSPPDQQQSSEANSQHLDDEASEAGSVVTDQDPSESQRARNAPDTRQVDLDKDVSKDVSHVSPATDNTQTDSATSVIGTREDSSQKVPEVIDKVRGSKDRSSSHQSSSRDVPQGQVQAVKLPIKSCDVSEDQRPPDIVLEVPEQKGTTKAAEESAESVDGGRSCKESLDSECKEETPHHENDKQTTPAKLQYPGITSTTEHGSSAGGQLSDSFSDDDAPRDSFVSGSDLTSDCASASNFSYSEASYSCSLGCTSEDLSGCDTSCALSDISGLSCPSPGSAALAELSSDSDADPKEAPQPGPSLERDRHS